MYIVIRLILIFCTLLENPLPETVYYVWSYVNLNYTFFKQQSCQSSQENLSSHKTLKENVVLLGYSDIDTRMMLIRSFLNYMSNTSWLTNVLKTFLEYT